MNPEIMQRLMAMFAPARDNTFVTQPKDPRIARAEAEARQAYSRLMESTSRSIWPPNPADTSGNLRTYGAPTGAPFSTPDGRRAATKADLVQTVRHLLTLGGGG